MSIIMPNGKPIHASTEPVTDYLYCGKCGIELPRPPTNLVAKVVACPCCDNPIQIANTNELWCLKVSDLLVPAELAQQVARKLGGTR